MAEVVQFSKKMKKQKPVINSMNGRVLLKDGVINELLLCAKFVLESNRPEAIVLRDEILELQGRVLMAT